MLAWVLAVVLSTCAIVRGAVVFTAKLDSGLLEVLDDDSYLVSLNGKPWLHNGTTGVHINGTWWTTTAADTPGCHIEKDVDYRGNDLYYVNDTLGADTCCTLCSKEPRCAAWTWTGQTTHSDKGSNPAAPPVWANRCYLKTSAAGRTDYGGHVSGTLGGQEKRLQRIGAQPHSGSSPTLGAFQAWNISYLAGDTHFVVSFVFYPTHQVLVFSQWFPSGAANINLTYAVNSTEGLKSSEFSSSMQPSTLFPTFTDATDGQKDFGAVTWSGRFASVSSTANIDLCSALQHVGGSEGGPLVVFNYLGTGLATSLVLAPFDNFKASILGGIATSDVACGAGAGVNGYVTDLPVNFATSFSLFLSNDGINAAMHSWGNVMQIAYNTTRIYDASSSLLTYWTDNGAYYDFYAYEPDINSKGLVEDIIVALDNTFRNGSYPGPALPVHYYMLDAYWMYNVRSDCNCKQNDTVWPVPFPHGLPWLSQQLQGKRFIIYNGPQCMDTTYAGMWPLESSLYFDAGWAKGTLSIIAGEASYSFYSSLFARQDLFMESFTQDFLDFNYLLFPAWLQASDGNHKWLAGQARAALERNISIQYCMALPSDFLEALQFPAVTNARASDDYGAGGSNWRMAGTSLLLSAVGLRASKDNFWSGSKMTDRGRESSPFLQAVVCSLSQGPVGFADALYHTNPAVLWPTMRADGVLLHPSRPATTIDGQFEEKSVWAGNDVRVASTYIAITRNSSSILVFYNALVVGSAASSVQSRLSLVDLYPFPIVYPYMMWMFNNTACATDGARADSCVTQLGTDGTTTAIASDGVIDGMSGDSEPWTLWTCAPVFKNGFVLLGEISKYVPVSPARFLLISPSPDGITITLVGAPSETLSIAYITSQDVVRVISIQLDPAGQGVYQLK